MWQRDHRTLSTRRHFSVYARKTRCCHCERWEWQEKGTKWVLTMTVAEAHSLFVGENPPIFVGKSKFAEFWQTEVLLLSKMPGNICGYIYHTNIALLLEEVPRKLPENFPFYGEDFVKSCVCNTTNKKYMTSNCVLCKTKFQTIYLDEIDKKHFRVAATWYQWEKGKDGQTEKNEKAPLKICCQLFKTCSQSVCCITLLISCKWKHIMHADWLQQQQIPTQWCCKCTSLKTSVFIRMKFPVPIGKQTHTVHSHDLVQGPKYINVPFVR